MDSQLHANMNHTAHPNVNPHGLPTFPRQLFTVLRRTLAHMLQRRERAARSSNPHVLGPFMANPINHKSKASPSASWIGQPGRASSAILKEVVTNPPSPSGPENQERLEGPAREFLWLGSREASATLQARLVFLVQDRLRTHDTRGREQSGGFHLQLVYIRFKGPL